MTADTAEEQETIAPDPKAPIVQGGVAVLDFGSQYTQLIARRVRELGVYSELLPHDATPEEIERLNPAAYILSGGPMSVYEEGAPQLPDYVLESGKPVLGICYGMQLITRALGGHVAPAQHREYGPATIKRTGESPLFHDLESDLQVWMSHGDRIESMPEGFEVLASSTNAPLAAMGKGNVLGIQFHPEVVHTPQGTEILRN